MQVQSAISQEVLHRQSRLSKSRKASNLLLAQQPNKLRLAVEADVQEILELTCADYSELNVRFLGWVFNKVFRSLYEKVVADHTQIQRLK